MYIGERGFRLYKYVIRYMKVNCLLLVLGNYRILWDMGVFIFN